jgi:hypothetical protein
MFPKAVCLSRSKVAIGLSNAPLVMVMLDCIRIGEHLSHSRIDPRNPYFEWMLVCPCSTLKYIFPNLSTHLFLIEILLGLAVA